MLRQHTRPEAVLQACPSPELIQGLFKVGVTAAKVHAMNVLIEALSKGT